MTDNVVLKIKPLGFPWETIDPFLFCVHHDDAYPEGTNLMGPAPSTLIGRNIGQDFDIKDGFRMYHGEVVPGFPQHPHRGFETVTVVRRGLVDHSDSMGATARYGQGDTQWLTAGGGIQHAEMFPLVESDKPNPLELFQIWLNLPAADKFAPPHFSMLWANEIPTHVARDAAGKSTKVTVVAGVLGKAKPPPPPPKSYASRPDSDVAIWTINMDKGAQWKMPKAKPGTNRMLYFFAGSTLRVSGKSVPIKHVAQLRGDVDALLEAGDREVELLLLQGKPIGEPVVQHGPFVMNSPAEIRQTIADYQRTRFGGWPWNRNDPVHAKTEGRFAKRPDGSVERPT
jgi:quercetin 2,3-dioxygenase